METVTLDDLMALNDELAALAEAGVPLDIGLRELGKDTAEDLTKINATIARRVSRGASLEEALESDDNGVPAAYRSFVLAGLRSGDLDAALDGSTRVATRVDECRYAVRSAFVYPIVVACLAYAGMIGCCLVFVPALENVYDSLRIPPGTSLLVLQTLRDTLPYWVAIPPVAMLLLLVWGLWTKGRRGTSVGRTSGLLSWFPGFSRAVYMERCASFSEELAKLVRSGVPLPGALNIVSGSFGDAGLAAGARGLATSIEQGQLPTDDSRDAQRFPPFLRWALLHSEETTGRDRALQMAASVYRRSSERRTARLRIVAPLVPCVVLGGGVTLLYGLALFAPVVHLLRALA